MVAKAMSHLSGSKSDAETNLASREEAEATI
jgi:hypothetical protein